MEKTPEVLAAAERIYLATDSRARDKFVGDCVDFEAVRRPIWAIPFRLIPENDRARYIAAVEKYGLPDA